MGVPHILQVIYALKSLRNPLISPYWKKSCFLFTLAEIFPCGSLVGKMGVDKIYLIIKVWVSFNFLLKKNQPLLLLYCLSQKNMLLFSSLSLSQKIYQIRKKEKKNPKTKGFGPLQVAPWLQDKNLLFPITLKVSHVCFLTHIFSSSFITSRVPSHIIL